MSERTCVSGGIGVREIYRAWMLETIELPTIVQHYAQRTAADKMSLARRTMFVFDIVFDSWVPHAGWGPHHTFFREGSGFG